MTTTLLENFSFLVWTSIKKLLTHSVAFRNVVTKRSEPNLLPAETENPQDTSSLGGHCLQRLLVMHFPGPQSLQRLVMAPIQPLLFLSPFRRPFSGGPGLAGI